MKSTCFASYLGTLCAIVFHSMPNGPTAQRPNGPTAQRPLLRLKENNGVHRLVQTIYMAYYQRPADPAGLRYWAEKLEQAGGDLKNIINAFANSAEAKALYQDITPDTIGTVIDAVYLAFFNRAPDAVGKARYVQDFKAGIYTPGTLVLDILNGSRNSDKSTVASKLAAANAFTTIVAGRELTDPQFGDSKAGAFPVTYKGNADADAARNLLADVTAGQQPKQEDIAKHIKDKIADKGDAIWDEESQPTEPEPPVTEPEPPVTEPEPEPTDPPMDTKEPKPENPKDTDLIKNPNKPIDRSIIPT